MFSENTKSKLNLTDVLHKLDNSNQIQQIKTVGNQPRLVSSSPNTISATNARALSTPAHVVGVQAAVNRTSDVSSKVTVSFQRDPGDSFYSKSVVYVTGYKGNHSPVQVATGDSPVSFALENTGEPVSVTVQAHGSLGPAPLQTAPNTTLQLTSTPLATTATTSGNGTGGATLETNGTKNSTQTVLNLTGSNGITASESGGTVTLAAPLVATAGNGWMTSWQGWPFSYSGNVSNPFNTAGTGTANAINVIQVVMPFTMTVRKFTTSFGAAVPAQQMGMGIYDASGNLLVSGGASTGAIARVTVSVGPITIQAGTVVYMAVTAGSATSACNFSFSMPASGASSNQGPAVWNKNSVKIGVATNVFAANVMPSTLGTINEYITGANVNHMGFVLEP